jgi:hypothetical protein
MTLQEIADQWQNLRPSVFENIMAGLRKSMDFRGRESATPFIKEAAIEDKIAFAPANQHRQRRESLQPVRNFFHQIEPTITGSKRNVLHETQDGDTIPP